MKNMTKAQENWQAPPPGRRLSVITAAEATVSKKSGASMLHLTVAIDDGSEFAGTEADDYIITDGTAKGAGMGKKKLRGLGTPLINRAIDTDEDIPDAAIAQELVGLKLFVDYGNEQRLGRAPGAGEDAPYDTPLFTTDANTGKQVPLNKLTVQGYSRHAIPGAQAQAPVMQQAPASFVPQQAAPQQQFVPQGYPQQAPQQFVPQAPQQQAFPGLPPGYVPPGGFPNIAQPAWNGGQPVQQVPVEAPKRGKKGAQQAEG